MFAVDYGFDENQVDNMNSDTYDVFLLISSEKGEYMEQKKQLQDLKNKQSNFGG